GAERCPPNTRIPDSDRIWTTFGVAFRYPREVFKPAILANEDNAVTSRLRQAGELLEIEVLDHVISESEKPPSFLTDALRDPPGCVTGCGSCREALVRGATPSWRWLSCSYSYSASGPRRCARRP